MKTPLAIIAVAALLLGCGKESSYSPKPATKVKDASVKPGEEASLFPMEVGNQWVYSVETAQGSFELTLKVTDVSREGDATIATLTSTNGTQQTQSKWRIDGTGIYQLSDGPDRVFEPPQLLVAFPLEEGKETSVTLRGPYPLGGQIGQMQTRSKYLGVQQIDTDMERLSALAVESLTTWTTEDGNAASRGMTWWAPGIGFVRQRQEVGIGQGRAVILMKLKSYSFK
jgi:hypothetical protein